MKRLVYVATPYDTLLKRGVKMYDVLANAIDGFTKANSMFKPKFEVFSPVLEWGLKHKDTRREDAMAMCLAKLKEATILYIPTQLGTTESKGILEEYKFATQNDICIVFEYPYLKEFFDEKLQGTEDEK